MSCVEWTSNKRELCARSPLLQVGMGLLIALIGMVSIKLVVADPRTVVALGDLSDVRIWLSLTGLALTGSLLFHQVGGGLCVAGGEKVWASPFLPPFSLG